MFRAEGSGGPGFARGRLASVIGIVAFSVSIAVSGAALAAGGFGDKRSGYRPPARVPSVPVVFKSPFPVSVGTDPWRGEYRRPSNVTVIIRQQEPRPVPTLGYETRTVIGIQNAPANGLAAQPAIYDQQPYRHYQQLINFMREQSQGAGPRIVTINGDKIDVQGPAAGTGPRIIEID